MVITVGPVHTIPTTVMCSVIKRVSTFAKFAVARCCDVDVLARLNSRRSVRAAFTHVVLTWNAPPQVIRAQSHSTGFSSVAEVEKNPHSLWGFGSVQVLPKVRIRFG